MSGMTPVYQKIRVKLNPCKFQPFFALAICCFLCYPAFAQTCTGNGTRHITVETCSGATAPRRPVLSISPNPAADFLLVKNTGGLLHFELFDLLGHTILALQLEGNATTRISTEHLSAGLYVAGWRAGPGHPWVFLKVEICK